MPRSNNDMATACVHMINYLIRSLFLYRSLRLLNSKILYNSNRLVIFFEAKLHHQIACQTHISRSAFILCCVLLCRWGCYDTKAVYSHFTINTNLARFPFSCLKSLRWTEITMLYTCRNIISNRWALHIYIRIWLFQRKRVCNSISGRKIMAQYWSVYKVYRGEKFDLFQSEIDFSLIQQGRNKTTKINLEQLCLNLSFNYLIWFTKYTQIATKIYDACS